MEILLTPANNENEFARVTRCWTGLGNHLPRNASRHEPDSVVDPPQSKERVQLLRMRVVRNVMLYSPVYLTRHKRRNRRFVLLLGTHEPRKNPERSA
jgi:hypothetical protein